MAEIYFAECALHGSIAMSVDKRQVKREANRHEENGCDGQLFLHIFQSDMSRKL